MTFVISLFNSIIISYFVAARMYPDLFSLSYFVSHDSVVRACIVRACIVRACIVRACLSRACIARFCIFSDPVENS